MTAATVTLYPGGTLAYEYAVLTLTDGETYVTKMSNPLGAYLTEANSDANAGSAVNLDYALSGRTFTLRYKQGGSAITDKKVAIMVFGRK